MPVALGAKLPHTFTAAAAAIPARARSLETAGFDSLWVSDHVVMPQQIASPYPFADDGRAPWTGDAPWVETIVTMSAAAAVTERVRIASGVLVLPQRNPVLLAKQVGSLDALSGGRIELGVGAGWLREEFEALDAPFEGRGGRTDEWIAVLRECWTGTPGPRAGGYPLAPDLRMFPTPVRQVPVLVGGHTKAALRRAGRHGDGWLPQQDLRSLDVEALARDVDEVRAHALGAWRDPASLRVTLRVVGSAGRERALAARLPELAAVGVDEVVVDVDTGSDPARVHDTLRAAA